MSAVDQRVTKSETGSRSLRPMQSGSIQLVEMTLRYRYLPQAEVSVAVRDATKEAGNESDLRFCEGVTAKEIVSGSSSR